MGCGRMRTQYAHTICAHNMRTQYAHTICAHNMRTQYVWKTKVTRSLVQCLNTFKLAEGSWVYEEKDVQKNTHKDGTSQERLTPKSCRL